MQLVIDIPEEAYKLLQNEGVDWLGAEHILNAVANGTPLPQEPCDAVSRKAAIDADVFDKIRAEIIELRGRQNVGVLECLEIIDKYKASPTGAEKEEKNDTN